MSSPVERAERRWAIVLLTPFLLTLVVFFGFAIVRVFYLSFFHYDFFNEVEWAGLENYLSLFTNDLFVKAVVNTVSFALVTTIIQCGLALAAAIALNNRIRAQGLFRTVFYLPSIMSSAAVTLIFLWFYQRNGYFNYFLSGIWQWRMPIVVLFTIAAGVHIAITLWERSRRLPATWMEPANAALALLAGVLGMSLLLVTGIVGPEAPSRLGVPWLTTRDHFGPMPVPLWAIMIQNAFTTFPMYMLIFLAGLQSVPRHLYEAADIDGAGGWNKFRYITLPSLKPVTFLVLTMSLIGTLQLFDQVALYGTATPLESKVTLAYFIYDASIGGAQVAEVGKASAAAIVLALLTLLVVTLQRRLGRFTA